MAEPLFNNPLVPGFDVSVNGSPISVDAQTHVVSLTVEEEMDWPGMFALELAASIDQDDPLAWVNDDTFAVGGKVKIKLGYADSLTEIFSGEITGLEPEFRFDKMPTLVVRGYHLLHRLTRGRKTRSFVQQKDSDIASQVASEAGMSADAADSEVTHDYVLQANQSDLEFLLERARRINYEVLSDDQTLVFRQTPLDAAEALTLSFESGGLLEFYPRLTSAFPVTEVKVRGWSPKDKKEIVGQARKGDEPCPMGGAQSGAAVVESAFGAAAGLVTNYPVMSQAEADQVAKARYNSAGLTLIEGGGVCYGRADLRAGKVIKIDAVGARFSGNYLVTAARHAYTPRGYYTHFEVRRNAS